MSHGSRRRGESWERTRVWRRAGAGSAMSVHSSTTSTASVTTPVDTSLSVHPSVLEVKMDDATIGSGDAHEMDDSPKRSGETATVAFRKYVDSHVHLDLIALRLGRKHKGRSFRSHVMDSRSWRKSDAVTATGGIHASGLKRLRSRTSNLEPGLEILPEFIRKNFGVEDGFDGCVTVSCDLRQMRNICWILDQPFAKEYGIVGAFGIHPHNAKDWTPAVAKELGERLDKYCGTGQCVALGECGLDFHVNVKKGHTQLLSDKPSQYFAFRQQCKMAWKKRLPLVLHSRAADEETLDILCDEFRSDEARKSQLIDVHCFNNSQWFAKQMMAIFPKAFFGFAGVITHGYDDLCKVAATIPLDRVLLETDGPYMAPVPYRYDELAHCGHIPVIAAKLAEIHGVAIDTVLRQCRENTRVMYGI